MAGPWEKFQSAPAEAGPWSKFAPIEEAPAPSIPKPGDTWTDAGGNSFEIIEPTARRSLGQLTPADVAARLAVKPMAEQPAPQHVGPTEMRAYTPEMRAQDVAATSDPKFVSDQIKRDPESTSLALKLMGEARAAERGPVETFARSAANTALLGAPRLAMSAFSDVPIALEHEMQKAADAKGAEINPTAAKAGAIVGTGAQALAIPGAAFATPARAALSGAVLGGAPTAIETRGDPVETVKAALLGAGGGYAVGKVLGGPQPQRVPIPATNDLRRMADEAYVAADRAGVVYTPEAVQRLRGDVQEYLAAKGYHPENQKGVSAALSELDRLSTENVTLKGMDTLRQLTSGGWKLGEKSNNKMIRGINERIDDLIANPRTGEVLMGDAQAGAQAIKDARDYWSRLSKAETVAQAMQKAERQAQRNGSGGNLDNSYRQKFSAILDNPGRVRGFSEDERKAMERIVSGLPGQDLARRAGKLSPTGNGLMTALGLIGAAANPYLAAAPGVGIVAKALSDRATRASAGNLDRLVRAGSKEAAGLLSTPSQNPQLSASQRLVQILLAQEEQQRTTPAARAAR